MYEPVSALEALPVCVCVGREGPEMFKIQVCGMDSENRKALRNRNT